VDEDLNVASVSRSANPRKLISAGKVERDADNVTLSNEISH